MVPGTVHLALVSHSAHDHRHPCCPAMPRRYLEEAARTAAFLNRQRIPSEWQLCLCLIRIRREDRRRRTPIAAFTRDCFVLLGFAEYALAARDPEVLKRAIDVYYGICARLAAGVFRTEPYPIPAGYRSHSIAMIRAAGHTGACRCGGKLSIIRGGARTRRTPRCACASQSSSTTSVCRDGTVRANWFRSKTASARIRFSRVTPPRATSSKACGSSSAPHCNTDIPEWIEPACGSGNRVGFPCRLGFRVGRPVPIHRSFRRQARLASRDGAV